MNKLKKFYGNFVRYDAKTQNCPIIVHLRGLGVVKLQRLTADEIEIEKKKPRGETDDPKNFQEFVPGPRFSYFFKRMSDSLDRRLQRLPTALCLIGAIAGTAALTAGIILVAPVAIALGAAAVVIGTALMFRTRPWVPPMGSSTAAQMKLWDDFLEGESSKLADI